MTTRIYVIATPAGPIYFLPDIRFPNPPLKPELRAMLEKP